MLMLPSGCWKWEENVKQHTLVQIAKSQIQLILRQVSIFIITLELLEYFHLIKKIYLQKRYRCYHNTRPKKNLVPRAKHLFYVATFIIQVEHKFYETYVNILLCYSLGV